MRSDLRLAFNSPHLESTGISCLRCWARWSHYVCIYKVPNVPGQKQALHKEFEQQIPGHKKAWMHANYVCKTKVHWDDAIPISDTDWSVKVDFIYWYDPKWIPKDSDL